MCIRDRRKGGPHAEVFALQAAGERAKGATAYVTLEPCAHTGSTGPCAEALMAAGVGRVVAAMRDPFPQVDGAGFEKLRAAGTVSYTHLDVYKRQGKRYYGGCDYVDVAEQLAIDRLKQLFAADYANVQPHSGSPVSYTHLDVYKRQLPPSKPYFFETSVYQLFFFL